MYLAHAPISFLANELIQRKKLSHLKKSERVIVGVFALFCGFLPDIDMFILMATTTPTFMHHTLISHTPLFYIAIWLFLKLLFWVLNKYFFSDSTKEFLRPKFINILIDTFLIATLFHLLMDLFAEDIMLLYPFSDQYFTLFRYTFEPNLFTGYFYSIAFGFELLACAAFAVYLFNAIFKKGKLLKAVNITLITIASLFLFYTVFIHINTYNQSYLFDSKGNTNNDVDYDGLSDGLDWDVNNNGKDNIQDIDSEKLVEEVQNIIKSGKWAVNDQSSSIGDVIKYKAGAFSSFRLIAQAYWNLHSPISPVLKDLATKEGVVYGYSWDYNSLDEFFNYYNNQADLKALNPDTGLLLAEGRFFFVINKDGKVINTGITLENNNIGIVLPNDRNLKNHNINDVYDFYGKDIKIMITQ
jgi:hypothetical protein